MTFTVRDFLQLPFTSEASEERQTRATGEGAFPRRACLTLHARLVLRSPEKRGKIGPVLLAMSLKDLQRMRTKVNILFHSFFIRVDSSKKQLTVKEDLSIGTSLPILPTSSAVNIRSRQVLNTATPLCLLLWCLIRDLL